MTVPCGVLAFNELQAQRRLWSSCLSGRKPRYTACERDSKSCLYYYRARYYDSNIDRFLTEDPAYFMPTLQQYGYVHNDPTNRLDPSGLADVYVWRPRPGHDSYGHAALKLRSGLNISWWPTNQGRNGAKSCDKCRHEGPKGRFIFVAPAVPNQTVADAQYNEQRPPDVIIHLDELDEDAIESWWHDFVTTTNTWDTVRQNCSTVVGNALSVGAHDHILRPRPFMWTPLDVEGYARQLQLREKIF